MRTYVLKMPSIDAFCAHTTYWFWIDLRGGWIYFYSTFIKLSQDRYSQFCQFTVNLFIPSFIVYISYFFVVSLLCSERSAMSLSSLTQLWRQQLTAYGRIVYATECLVVVTLPEHLSYQLTCLTWYETLEVFLTD